jgi:hypothetical protein
MSVAVKQLLGRFGSLVSHVLINEPDQFVAFGSADHDDLVIRGSLETRSKTFGLFTAHGPTSDSLERCQMLFRMIRDLTDQGFHGTFNLTASQVTNIKQCIQKMDATHVRFHSEKNGIHVSIFDVRRFDYENRIVRGKEVRLVVDTLSKQDAYSFSGTLTSATFLKLMDDSYSVSIGRNNITRLSGNNSSLDYLFRNQEYTEPVSFSSTEQFGSEIALWLHSNSYEQVIHTTQQQDLE